jgi:hypothetical protein
MIKDNPVQVGDVRLHSNGKLYCSKKEVSIPELLHSLLKGKGPNHSISVKIEQIVYVSNNTNKTNDY